jgi:Tfp pilus assembly protein PilF
MMKFVIIRIITICFLIIFFIPNITSAETKTFIKEYTYQASDEDSKNSCRVIALREVKRLLLEELGTYLESATEVQSFMLSKDQITTLTAGIVQTELIEEKWNTENLKYWLKAKITANSSEVIKSIDFLRKDRQKTKELEEARKHSEDLLKENERLRRELATAKGENREQKKSAYSRNIKELSADDWFEKGSAYFNAGNYTDAIDSYSKTIELSPGYDAAYTKRGWAYVNLSKLSQAIKDYEKVTEINPVVKTDFIYIQDDKKIIRTTGYNYWHYPKSVEENIESIKSDSNNILSFVCRGLLYEIIGKWQQAIQNYDKAIELDPSDANIYRYRGRCYRSYGQYEKAIHNFDMAIKLNPKITAAFWERGIIYANSKNHERAIEDYNKATELDPGNAWVYLAKGYSYNQLGKDKKAIEEYKMASKLGNKESQDFLRDNGISW